MNSAGAPGTRLARRFRAALEYYVLSAPLLLANLTYRQYRTACGPEADVSADMSAPAQLR